MAITLNLFRAQVASLSVNNFSVASVGYLRAIAWLISFRERFRLRAVKQHTRLSFARKGIKRDLLMQICCAYHESEYSNWFEPRSISSSRVLVS